MLTKKLVSQDGTGLRWVVENHLGSVIAAFANMADADRYIVMKLDEIDSLVTDQKGFVVKRKHDRVTAIIFGSEFDPEVIDEAVRRFRAVLDDASAKQR